MPHDRFYHPDLEAPLTGDEHHHLHKVMRAKPGDQIELIDGKGTLAQAQIDTIDKQTAHFTILSKTTASPPPPLILSQALVKQPKLELIIEKCTELGITDFHLFPASNSERDHLSDNHQKRLHIIALSATKQCGRLFLPTIHFHPALHILPNSAFATLQNTPPHLSTLKLTSILIGPEKGWTPQEEKTLIQSATPATLHENTLRAETAAITASAYLSLTK